MCVLRAGGGHRIVSYRIAVRSSATRVSHRTASHRGVSSSSSLVALFYLLCLSITSFCPSLSLSLSLFIFRTSASPLRNFCPLDSHSLYRVRPLARFFLQLFYFALICRRVTEQRTEKVKREIHVDSDVGISNKKKKKKKKKKCIGNNLASR